MSTKKKPVGYSKDNMSPKPKEEQYLNMMRPGCYYYVRSTNSYLNYQRALALIEWVNKTKFTKSREIKLIIHDDIFKYTDINSGAGPGYSICVWLDSYMHQKRVNVTNIHSSLPKHGQNEFVKIDLKTFYKILESYI